MAAKPKPDDKKQAAAFRKAARELGADASDQKFREALRKIAKHKPQGSIDAAAVEKRKSK